jgi:hypothetical protein
VFGRSLAKLPQFFKLEINGNELCERAVEEMHRIFYSAKKLIGGLAG